MKLKIFFVAVCSLAFVGAAIAKDPRQVIVPFVYIGLGPNQQLEVTYKMDEEKTIFCQENNGRPGFTAEWVYKGQKFTSKLPVTLKTTEKGEGQMADASGIAYIKNGSNSNRDFLSCKYQNIQ